MHLPAALLAPDATIWSHNAHIMQLNATVAKRPTQNFPWSNKGFSTSPFRCIDGDPLAPRYHVILYSLLSKQVCSLHSSSKSPPLTYPHLDCALEQYQPYNSHSSTSNRFRSNLSLDMHFPTPFLQILPHKPYFRILADKVLIRISPLCPPCPRTASTYAPTPYSPMSNVPPNPRSRPPILACLQTITTTVQAQIPPHQRLSHPPHQLRCTTSLLSHSQILLPQHKTCTKPSEPQIKLLPDTSSNNPTLWTPSITQHQNYGFPRPESMGERKDIQQTTNPITIIHIRIPSSVKAYPPTHLCTSHTTPYPTFMHPSSIIQPPNYPHTYLRQTRPDQNRKERTIRYDTREVMENKVGEM